MDNIFVNIKNDDDNTIQIGIACGYNCEKYIDFLIFSILKTYSKEINLEFLLGINNNVVNVNFLENIFIKNNLKYKTIKFDLKNNTSIPSSYNHGLCLNEIFKHMDKKYGMFIDCDVVVLEKNWDKKLLKMFTDNVAIIGSEYDGRHYKGFPNVIFCLFKTEILKKCNINFLPIIHGMPNYNEIKRKNIIQENDKYLKYYDYGEWGEMILDVGWELPVKLLKNNYTGIKMNLVTPRKKETIKKIKFLLPIETMRGDEFQLNNVTYCCHVGRSSSRSFDCEIIKKWRNRTLEWLNKY